MTAGRKGKCYKALSTLLHRDHAPLVAGLLGLILTTEWTEPTATAGLCYTVLLRIWSEEN